MNLCRDNGVSLEVAMALTSHKDINVVLEYYRAPSSADLDAACATLSKVAREVGA